MYLSVIFFPSIIFCVSPDIILPSGYSAIRLGMPLESVKDELLADGSFGYRGERDVSLLPSENRILIETPGLYFLSRCWFQFYNESLYIITVNLNQELIDHYTVFSALCEKYGEPDSINPQKSVWQSDTVIMTLEKPLTLKYIDAQVFAGLQNHSLVEKAALEYSKQQFLEGL